MVGMEIRHKVEQYVHNRIVALRSENEVEKKPTDAGSFHNISVMRMNCMKFLPNFFERGQVCLEFMRGLLTLMKVKLRLNSLFFWLAFQNVFPLSRSSF